MQFIVDGPDIPEALLQAHEEGRVVFFCGAGVSYPSGLPGFKGLVEQIYELNGTSFTDIERAAFDRSKFDATLDLLERRLPGQRLAVRRALARSLRPKLRRKGAVDTQAALLRLARSRDGALRLVTTNFDRTFHAAAKRMGQPFPAYPAPMLPIPKNSRWDGLVFLHGLLPESEDDAALHRLVATSGDFGLAYLTERWAARFVSELFRNYVVCFIGYSIDDPVLRYMMDALAADRMLGEVTPQAWAFGDCEAGKEHLKTLEWEAKGVRPILYRVQPATHDHSALHDTIRTWADVYRDGVQGKEAIVAKHAMAQPQDSTLQDDFVGRMLWALSDKSGLPAKRFAEFNPVPPLEWLLEAFSHERFLQRDLARFGFSSVKEEDAELRFSLVRRPAPYDHAPPMTLASSGSMASRWDGLMFQLARWLVRHLDDPRLIIWIAERGGQMDSRWISLVDSELERLATLERDGKVSELDLVRLDAPKGVPDPKMRTLWRIVLGGRLKTPLSGGLLYRWIKRLRREGLNTSLRMELRSLLSPKITLRRPFVWDGEVADGADETVRIKQLVDWDLVLAEDNVHAVLQDQSKGEWEKALPLLYSDLQQLLCDALGLLRDLGEADDLVDRSYWDLPSITPHWQNRSFRDWVSLIELLRDAWLAVRATDESRSTLMAQAWFEIPYPTFKRLALFAASQDNCIEQEQWVDWLLLDEGRWLWSQCTAREVLRLLVLQGRILDNASQARLENGILAGPPREMYRDDLEPERWDRLVARAVWIRLAKLESSGLHLGVSAARRLAEISIAHPELRLDPNEKDEFSHWMSGTGDPDFEDGREVDVAPRTRKELVEWLESPRPAHRPFYEDTWRDVCRTRFFHSLAALCDLAHQDVWPAVRWREALQVWSDDSMAARSWQYASPLVLLMPDEVLSEIAPAVAWWMEATSRSGANRESLLLTLTDRVLALPIPLSSGMTRNGEPIDNPVSEAINHPIGHATRALLNLWFKRAPNDGDLLPPELKAAFSAICDVEVDRFRHGRVLLASRLIALYRVDRAWTEATLLPLFDWSNPVEAKAAWEGFLWSPRLYQPLMVALKSQFLLTAGHYADLGEHRGQFSAFLTHSALGPLEGYSRDDFRSALGKLPQDGLEKSAQSLSQALEAAGDQREDFWRNRVQPFWQEIWPKSRNLATPSIAASLARLAIAARDEFPSALKAVRDWLQPVANSDNIVHLLRESGLCSQSPTEALDLLGAVVGSQQWAPLGLNECLAQVRAAAPDLEQNNQFHRLEELVRTRS
ncbi:anti-phage defense-associated sirtuin Dsr1 [Stenotrophomonas muris]|uniref:anti-phage defense-associated sirtuin Dsr1 n=1 Tax=Stenotrophomonas muris TaxID=2963283 RepID=UPI003F819876